MRKNSTMNNKEKITQWLLSHNVQNFSIFEHFSHGYVIDVQGDLDLSNKNLNKLPYKFSHVTKGCYLSGNCLTSLEGAPEKVGEDFDCSHNELISLDNFPYFVGGSIFCHENKIKDLKGIAQIINGSFTCYANQLQSLENGPKIVNGSMYCNDNLLKSLKGCPEEIHENFCFSSNDIQDLFYLPKYVKHELEFEDNPMLESIDCLYDGQSLAHLKKVWSAHAFHNKLENDLSIQQKSFIKKKI